MGTQLPKNTGAGALGAFLPTRFRPERVAGVFHRRRRRGGGVAHPFSPPLWNKGRFLRAGHSTPALLGTAPHRAAAGARGAGRPAGIPGRLQQPQLLASPSPVAAGARRGCTLSRHLRRLAFHPKNARGCLEPGRPPSCPLRRRRRRRRRRFPGAPRAPPPARPHSKAVGKEEHGAPQANGSQNPAPAFGEERSQGSPGGFLPPSDPGARPLQSVGLGATPRRHPLPVPCRSPRVSPPPPRCLGGGGVSPPKWTEPVLCQVARRVPRGCSPGDKKGEPRGAWGRRAVVLGCWEGAVLGSRCRVGEGEGRWLRVPRAPFRLRAPSGGLGSSRGRGLCSALCARDVTGTLGAARRSRPAPGTAPGCPLGWLRPTPEPAELFGEPAETQSAPEPGCGGQGMALSPSGRAGTTTRDGSEACVCGPAPREVLIQQIPPGISPRRGLWEPGAPRAGCKPSWEAVPGPGSGRIPARGKASPRRVPAGGRAARLGGAQGASRRGAGQGEGGDAPSPAACPHLGCSTPLGPPRM